MTTSRPRLTQCPQCSGAVVQSGRGRPAVYCSTECRRSAYEIRKIEHTGRVPIKVVTQVEAAPPVTLDQHVVAVLAAPSACRRVLKELDRMAGDGALGDPRWRGVPEAATRLAARFGFRPRVH
ncbi:MAG: hypothetical protein ACR2H3_08940 [Acidimicrobiales bacterium]